MQRRRVSQTVSLDARLAERAKQLREIADALPSGPERDAMKLKARQAETASHLNQWITSAGLQPPQ